MPKEKKGSIIKGQTKGTRYGMAPGRGPQRTESKGTINKAGRGTRYGMNPGSKAK